VKIIGGVMDGMNILLMEMNLYKQGATYLCRVGNRHFYLIHKTKKSKTQTLHAEPNRAGAHSVRVSQSKEQTYIF
jgi:hypothetical protein